MKKNNHKKKKKKNFNKKKVNKNKKVVSSKKKQTSNTKKKKTTSKKRVTKKELLLKQKREKRIKTIINVTLLILLLFSFILIKNSINNNDSNTKKIEKVDNKILKEKYDNCLNQKYNENDDNDLIKVKKSEIDKLINENNYDVSVKYEDLELGFTYSFLEDNVYYGASLIKLVDALYLIDKSINEGLDLDKETIKYQVKYVTSSKCIANYKLGTKISLRDIIRCAITVSDNTAHNMLIDYIGTNNLKNYGKSLGAKVILQGGDKFGNQTVNDTTIYLKRAYEIIKNYPEYGEFLKEIMGNDYKNSYNTDDIKIYHKYGSWDNVYHDIGLNLDIPHPYAISILTYHNNSNYELVIKNIHSKIMELHDLFYENRIKYCQSEIYQN